MGKTRSFKTSHRRGAKRHEGPARSLFYCFPLVFRFAVDSGCQLGNLFSHTRRFRAKLCDIWNLSWPKTNVCFMAWVIMRWRLLTKMEIVHMAIDRVHTSRRLLRWAVKMCNFRSLAAHLSFPDNIFFSFLSMLIFLNANNQL